MKNTNIKEKDVAARPDPCINANGKLSAVSIHRSYLDINGPKSLTGGDYIYRLTQGGCSVGKYLYTCMVEDERLKIAKCVVVKIDLENGTVAGYSEELEMGHANDMTYNPDDNTIVVAYCTDGSILKILDADTLKLKDTVRLQHCGVFSISYDPIRKYYVGPCHNYINYVNSDFSFIRKVPYKNNGNPKQGVFSDGTYMYMLEYWRNPYDQEDMRNVLLVYDLDTAELVNQVDLGIRCESENITWWNGKFYVTCNNRQWYGSRVYEVEIKSSEE